MPMGSHGRSQEESEESKRSSASVDARHKSPSKDVVEMEPLTVDVVPPMMVEYAYSDPMLAQFNPATVELMLNQIEADRANIGSVPLLQYDSERVPLNGELTELKLGDLIAVGSFSTVFYVAGRPDLVIKYELFCGAVGHIHPLLRDYWYQAQLIDLGITPTVHFVSPPVRPTFPLTAKLGLSSSLEALTVCFEKPTSAVRYMVMDRVGDSLYSLMDASPRGQVPFKQAIAICAETIRNLEQIHKRGIVHGDIHPGNIVAMNPEGTRYGLLDFGTSFFAADNDGKLEHIRQPLSRVTYLMSPYALMGSRVSFRDDVFRAVYSAAVVMNGQPYLDYVQSLEAAPDALMDFKTYQFLFELPTRRSVIRGPFSDARETAWTMGLLQQLLDLTRFVGEVDNLPRYDMILGVLDKLLRGYPAARSRK